MEGFFNRQLVPETGAGVGQGHVRIAQLAIVFVGIAVKTANRLVKSRAILALCFAQAGMHNAGT